ncbi:hypothetical protein SESBI_41671 [Sesbania bispinosa]|nr:hypothetical protein SESBI_41671 [Sesbania bispinosa]
MGPNRQLSLQNNAVGMQTQPQLGAGNHQNQNLMPPFMPNMQPPPMNTPPFMNAANQLLPLQNNQLHLPHMGLAGPQQGQSHVGGLGPQNSVGNTNYSPMFPVQGQVTPNVAQMNLSQLQGQILAQSILNMLQQPNMNMNMNIPNGQFCTPYPVQNMNQQLPMQVSNPSQVVPYGMPPGHHPMFGFPNQVPQAMVPQNLMFSANPQLGLVPGNQVRPQTDLNDKNLVPPTVNTNAFISAPLSSQQLQGNSPVPPNPNFAQPHHSNKSQPSAFMKSHSQNSSCARKQQQQMDIRSLNKKIVVHSQNSSCACVICPLTELGSRWSFARWNSFAEELRVPEVVHGGACALELGMEGSFAP